jgi:hypothetical protein
MKRAGPKSDGALIESIYEAALDRERWPAVLDQVRIRLGASNAVLLMPATPPGEGWGMKFL